MKRRPVDVVVISDLHLGTYACRSQEILAYLKSISPKLLILNGDIIDIWQFSKRYFPASHMAVIKEIFQMLSDGTRVIYITGNHDELLRRYTDLELGNLQLVDKMVIEIDGKTTWIFHGDAFDNTTKGGAKFLARLGSNGYAVLLGFNRFLNRCMKLIGREPLPLSKSIMNQLNKSIIRINDFEMLVAELAIEKNYDYVICSHLHQPGKRIVKTDKGIVVYMNSGDWVEHLSSLEYYNKEWHTWHYEEEQLQAPCAAQIKTEADVMTDEVNIYLHSLHI